MCGENDDGAELDPWLAALYEESQTPRAIWRERHEIPRVDARNLEATDEDVLEELVIDAYRDRARRQASDPATAEGERLMNDPAYRAQTSTAIAGIDSFQRNIENLRKLRAQMQAGKRVKIPGPTIPSVRP